MKKILFCMLILALSACLSSCGHNHKFDQTEVIKEVTCTEDGEVKRICSCGEYIIEPVDATGHDVVKVNKTEATCLASGIAEHYECKNCHKNFIDSEAKRELSDVVIKQVSHQAEKVAPVEPTCTQVGYSLHYECKMCHKYFNNLKATTEIQLEDFTIPAAGHTIVSKEARAETCTLTGYATHFECEKCGEWFNGDGANATIITKTITNPHAHTMTFVGARESTCALEGCIDHYECSECKLPYSDAEGKSVLSHDKAFSTKLPHTLAYTVTSYGNVNNVNVMKCTVCKQVQDITDNMVLGLQTDILYEIADGTAAASTTSDTLLGFYVSEAGYYRIKFVFKSDLDLNNRDFIVHNMTLKNKYPKYGETYSFRSKLLEGDGSETYAVDVYFVEGENTIQFARPGNLNESVFISGLEVYDFLSKSDVISIINSGSGARSLGVGQASYNYGFYTLYFNDIDTSYDVTGTDMVFTQDGLYQFSTLGTMREVEFKFILTNKETKEKIEIESTGSRKQTWVGDSGNHCISEKLVELNSYYQEMFAGEEIFEPVEIPAGTYQVAVQGVLTNGANMSNGNQWPYSICNGIINACLVEAK